LFAAKILTTDGQGYVEASSPVTSVAIRGIRGLSRLRLRSAGFSSSSVRRTFMSRDETKWPKRPVFRKRFDQRLNPAELGYILGVRPRR
jgi:hypothetical protein